MRISLALVTASVLATLLAGCSSTPAPAPIGLLDVTSRPAERALQSGMRSYEDAQYIEAEKQLNLALQTGLVSPRDRGAAQKTLAFIFCTSNRMSECEAAFRAAKKADPTFSLSKSEQGHPLWGPVYKRLQP